MNCPDEEQLALFVERTLSKSDREVIERHVEAPNASLRAAPQGAALSMTDRAGTFGSSGPFLGAGSDRPVSGSMTCKAGCPRP